MKELIPLENEVLRNERKGKPSLSAEKQQELKMKAKKAGFWGINTPEEYGGADIGQMMQAFVSMEISKTFVPIFPKNVKHLENQLLRDRRFNGKLMILPLKSKRLNGWH